MSAVSAAVAASVVAGCTSATGGALLDMADDELSD